MTGSVSIDFSIPNVWLSWQRFDKGKTRNNEFLFFEYDLLNNLTLLQRDLEKDQYKHGGYRKFVVNDSKKREVSVATVRDRVVHRLLYDYLVQIFDKTFIYDTWSCRKNKGLIAGIERAQAFALKNKAGYFYRGDVEKFFDNVDHSVLFGFLKRKIKDEKALRLIWEIIATRERERERESKAVVSRKGIPIGNLTSQIFANIYLNELDVFVKKDLKIKDYLRYGDDFLIFGVDLYSVKKNKDMIDGFIANKLAININKKNNYIGKVEQGIRFCGVQIFANGRRLNKRMRNRIFNKLNCANIARFGSVSPQYKQSGRQSCPWWTKVQGNYISK